MVIGIVGLGLMGGSLGLALKKTVDGVKLVGFDHNQTHCDEAKSLGLVDEIVSFDTLKKSDVIILAIPVEAIIKTFEELKDIDIDTTVIDLGSTKAKNSLEYSQRDSLKLSCCTPHGWY